MGISNILLWTTPLLLIPASFLAHKFIGFRTFRYYLYTVILFGAFFLNLTGYSFKYDVLDKVLYLVVAFSLMEIYWVLISRKKRNIKIIFSCAAIVLFAVGFEKWIIVGPGHFNRFWDNQLTGTFNLKSKQWYLKERDNCKLKNPSRELTLSRSRTWSPLEKRINSYVPDGYYGMGFSFKWSKTSAGARVDIVASPDTLWTLGEGF